MAGVRIWGHKQETASPSGKRGHSPVPTTLGPHLHLLGSPRLARPQRGLGGPRGWMPPSLNAPARSTRGPSTQVPMWCPPLWAPRGCSHHSSLSQAGGSDPAARSPGPGGGAGEPSGPWPHPELSWGHEVGMTAHPVLSTPKPRALARRGLGAQQRASLGTAVPSTRSWLCVDTGPPREVSSAHHANWWATPSLGQLPDA